MFRCLENSLVVESVDWSSVPSAEAWSRSYAPRSHTPRVCEDWSASSHYHTPVHFLSIVCLSFLWTLQQLRPPMWHKHTTVRYTCTALFSFEEIMCLCWWTVTQRRGGSALSCATHSWRIKKSDNYGHPNAIFCTHLHFLNLFHIFPSVFLFYCSYH